MELTSLIAKVVGPVLLLRALSILLDRRHFVEMVRGLDREVSTVSFSVFPIALLMTCIALAISHSDTSSVAAILIHVIAWGGMLKASALILFPGHVVTKVRALLGIGQMESQSALWHVAPGHAGPSRHVWLWGTRGAARVKPAAELIAPCP